MSSLARWLLPWFALAASAAVPHYDVKLTVDFDAQRLHGQQSVRAASPPNWDRQPDLTVHSTSQPAPGTTQFTYTAAPTRGLRWLTTEPGLFTAFHCNAWMLCDTSPHQRATLRLEIVVKQPGLRAAGPGVERKSWHDAEGDHWLFETPAPAQTFLFSFAIARLQATKKGPLEILAPTPNRAVALEHSARAARFFRQRTGFNAVSRGYRQVFLPQPGSLGQEAAGIALLTSGYLAKLESNVDLLLMTHELAHQWWGVAVGIRSWSDFWLNEGVAEYTSLLYLEHAKGREPFLAEIAKLRERLASLKAAGKDRPLHFEHFRDAVDALGPLPYVKGALFLHTLREHLGDETFWRAMGLYTRRHAGTLVDSRDFQRAFEQAAGRDLSALFNPAVYGL